MAKKDILSKFNLKDYNQELEQILEKKDFTSQVKNLLLSMFYKLEIGYKDYIIVKKDSQSKEEFLESIMYIIKEKCDKIELIEPKEDEQDVKKYIAYPEEKKIACYQNEASILHALLELGDKYFNMQNVENIIKEPLKTMLKEGYELDIKEVLTNFDGWSWNNNFDKTDKIELFMVYELLKIIMGNSFMYEWKRDRREDKDYLKEIRKKSRDIYDAVCRTCVIILSKDKDGKEYLTRELKNTKAKLLKMENKTEFLKEKYEARRKLIDEIKIIDKTINNREMLKEEFAIRNGKLPDDKKIFSISDLADILQDERKEISKENESINSLLEPKNYLGMIERLRDEIAIIENSNYKNVNDKVIEKELINLHRVFIGHIRKFLSITENKKEIQELVLKFRYYLYLPIKINNNIIEVKDAPELKMEIAKLEKQIITKACKSRIITIINQDISYNAKIIKKIINTKQTNLSNITVAFSKEENDIKINIYDGEVLDRTETIKKDMEKDFRIKFDKKIKLFI